ncbi:MAG: DUF1841 family protein [Acidiferrobacterales bacterium]|nr:DUF1841 family protein [Acidiferrobacterales bacterium]
MVDPEQRTFLFDLWEKIENNHSLSSMEKQVKKVIYMHPETHSVFSNRQIFTTHEFDADEPDPFAHIGLHSIVVEMISDDSPSGIRSVYDRWVALTGDKHEVQHEMMSALFSVLIESTDEISDSDGDARLMALLTERLNNIIDPSLGHTE